MHRFIVSEHFLCLATIVEMILNDIGITQYDRFVIAESLGIVLPLSEYGWIRGAQYSDNMERWGIPFNERRLNDFFAKRSIPLYADYTFATPFSLTEEEINTWQDCYVIILLSYGEYNGNLDLLRCGHAVFYLGKSDEKLLTIYDPGPDESGKKRISASILGEAMYQRKGGYIRIFKQFDGKRELYSGLIL